MADGMQGPAEVGPPTGPVGRRPHVGAGVRPLTGPSRTPIPTTNAETNGTATAGVRRTAAAALGAVEEMARQKAQKATSQGRRWPPERGACQCPNGVGRVP